VTLELARNLYLFQYLARSRNKALHEGPNSCPVGVQLKGEAIGARGGKRRKEEEDKRRR
jgi:hypothetical protein